MNRCWAAQIIGLPEDSQDPVEYFQLSAFYALIKDLGRDRAIAVDDAKLGEIARITDNKLGGVSVGFSVLTRARAVQTTDF